ncbi:uncharacterized protein F5Z01DRAFT_414620 [Emericellopsis atlantica]|uniref:Uncharacterized protein n=1 Tax=Emericellopsis atlantica TaxID=2614577 RepID=A0A9P7ZU20_9HYPO|nr:uncharacterized protein F5Z01DRAFT_414620 [Emericellopsis atlantica]KAG9257762.1 hypothetical protein F5Z01DRAFT_414620 [Emericellopsis atlantica]
MSARDERAAATGTGVSDGWIAHLRRRDRRVKCSLCEAEMPKSLETFREHVQATHGDLAQDTAAVEAAFARMNLNASDMSATRSPAQRQPQTTRKRQNLSAGSNEPGPASGDANDDEPVVKRLRSPPLTRASPRHGPSSPSTPTATNGRQQALKDSPEEFSRGTHRAPASGRKLFDPATDSATRGRGRGASRGGTARPPPAAQPRPAPLTTFAQGHVRIFIQEKPQVPNSVQEREPFTTPMTPAQLAAEVTKISKMIADGQERCTKWTTAKKATPDAKITPEEWYLQWLEHRALLNNHYDLLMACQDPAGQDTLTYIPVERDMPAKLWQFGIYQYLELLRTRLPDAYEPLVCFLYTAYGLLGLLRETNPLFQDTWTECLGDLARYRYAIENKEEVREHWEGVSRTWYMYTSDKLPHVGRLYHHFAVLNRGFVVPQLCYWAKSLCVLLPFEGTRASIRKLYDPLFGQATSDWFRRDIRLVTTGDGEQATGDEDGDAEEERGAASSSDNAIHKHRMVDMTFALVLGILFTGEHEDLLDEAQAYYLRSLDTHIAMMSKRWLESGYQTGIAIACNLLGYWHQNGNEFRDNEATRAEFDVSLIFLTQVYEIAIRRTGDTNTLPFAHTILTFLLHVSKYPAAMARIAERFPWDLTADMLNYWLFTARNNKSNPQFREETFPGSHGEQQPTRPLPEDYAMRGLWYTDDYFPMNWFRNSKVEFEERYFERRSLVDLRVERILWIAMRLSKAGDWLVFDVSLEKFGAAGRFVMDVSG